MSQQGRGAEVSAAVAGGRVRHDPKPGAKNAQWRCYVAARIASTAVMHSDLRVWCCRRSGFGFLVGFPVVVVLSAILCRYHCLLLVAMVVVVLVVVFLTLLLFLFSKNHATLTTTYTPLPKLCAETQVGTRGGV